MGNWKIENSGVLGLPAVLLCRVSIYPGWHVRLIVVFVADLASWLV